MMTIYFSRTHEKETHNLEQKAAALEFTDLLRAGWLCIETGECRSSCDRHRLHDPAAWRSWWLRCAHEDRGPPAASEAG